MNRQASLTHHLQHNHFPPVPTFGGTLETCERAIDLIADGTDAMVPMPDWARTPELMASEIVRQLHLDSYVDDAREAIEAEQDRPADPEESDASVAGDAEFMAEHLIFIVVDID